jgi:hypothetical protein
VHRDPGEAGSIMAMAAGSREVARSREVAWSRSAARAAGRPTGTAHRFRRAVAVLVAAAAVVVSPVAPRPVAATAPASPSGAAVLTVTAAGPGQLVERRVDLGALLGTDHVSGPLEVREADATGAPSGPALPVQFDPDRPGSSTGTLLFRLDGGGAGTRHVLLAPAGPGDAAAVTAAGITVADVVDDGFAAWRITTQTATWWYHKGGGAFSRAVDPAGNDWISWNTTPRYDGMFRGVGNVGKDWFHPGWNGATSSVVAAGPLKVTLQSSITIPSGQTNAGVWEHRVEIYDTFVRDTFTKTGADTWWFLYEGTPGGPVNGGVRSGIDIVRGTVGGPRTQLAHPGEFLTAFGAKGYTVFAVPAQNRSMFFSHLQAEATNSLRWHPSMSIFGFGRDSGVAKTLSGPGHVFLYGLTDTADGAEAAARIAQFWTAGEPGGGGSGPSGSGFVAVTPTRVFDTRYDQGPALTAGQVRTLTLGSLPVGASAAVLNVTATGATAPAFVRVWPAGTPMPTTSSLNLTPGDTVPNVVTTGLGAGRMVSLATSDGSTHVLVDLVGYYLPSAPSGGFHPVVPVRAYDSRLPDPPSPLGPGATVEIDVAAALGIDPSSVAGVVLNTTVTGPTAGGFLTVHPAGSATPLASNLNFRAGQTVANAVVVGVSGGRVAVFNPAGSTHVVVDVMGYFETGPAGARFTPVAPARVRDTRDLPSTPVGPEGSLTVAVSTPSSGVPADATAVVANLTVVGPTAASFVTVWPAGSPRPFASVQNSVPGMVRANQVTVGVGASGMGQFNSNGSVHLVTDVTGYFR